ncbi:helix-turn-helix transcriptional regulator [Methylosarcina fibrata]|uniref:helix-turn-helix transcriptional regulator n=1 Tax=Methylosarcina fibrata TaxID=105972 RepID=UPI000374691F|nr:HTH domain-containing protein [Methylosarcina fibrata]
MLRKISSRQHQILELLLKNRSGLSIDNIAEALGISRTAVKQHFFTIENEGYIRKDQSNKTAGRPATLYVITDKGINYFPKQYAWFLEMVLGNLIRESGPEQFKSYMSMLGTALAQKLRGRFEGKSLNARMKELAAVMEELGYQTEAVSDNENNTVSIQAHNCVFHDLAQKHAEICALDLALMSRLLDREVNQSDCMAKGDCVCRFSIKKIEDNSPG